MKVKTWALLFGIASLVQAPPTLAQVHAAPGSIASLLQTLSPLITNIPIPSYGTIGGLSLGTLGTVPGLSTILTPVFGSFTGGGLTISEGIGLIEAVSPLQTALPGLANIGSFH